MALGHRGKPLGGAEWVSESATSQAERGKLGQKACNEGVTCYRGVINTGSWGRAAF